MFAYIPFGSSKSALTGELENDLTYTSNLSLCDLLSIYMYARSIERETKKETKGERQFETTRGATRVKVIGLGAEWAEGSLDFVSVDER